MNSKIKVLCTDIDGTLLDSRRELADRTIASIKRIKDQLPVILASSRMPSAMRHLQQQLDIMDHPLICYNGGYVIRYNEVGMIHVLDTVVIPLPVCEEIIRLTRDGSLHVSLYHADEWYAPQIDQWAERESRITKVVPVIKSPDHVMADWKLQQKGAHKIMCMGAEDEIQQLEDTLSTRYKASVHAYRSKSTYLEISSRAISKASAMALVVKQLYDLQPADVMAFGDNYNDIEMLTAAGWGVAVENARPEVKAVSNEITSSNILDGVAETIDRYFNL